MKQLKNMGSNIVKVAIMAVATFQMIIPYHAVTAYEAKSQPVRSILLPNLVISVPSEAVMAQLPEKSIYDKDAHELTSEEIEQMIREISREAGVDEDMMVRIAWCESRFDPLVRGRVDSRDRGLFQYNSYYNPHVTDELAFDPEEATRIAVDDVKQGRVWKWVCAKRLGYAR